MEALSGSGGVGKRVRMEAVHEPGNPAYDRDKNRGDSSE